MNIFLSYHTPDRALSRGLAAALKEQLPGADVFFDVSRLRYGYHWQRALYDAIGKSDAFIILVGNRLGNWQTAEYYEAHDKKVNNPDSFVLLPIITGDRSKGPLLNLPGLSRLHWIEATEPTSPDILANVVAALKGEPPSASKAWRMVNPYRGLLALEEQDADFFFGRDAKTCQLLDHIAARKAKVLSLIGNSGVGKSSLAQAGVVAALKRQRWPSRLDWPDTMKGSRKWAILSLRPSNEPIRALASAFVNLRFDDPTEATRFRKIEDWTKRLIGENGSLRELLQATEDQFVAQGDQPPPRIVLYVDQGEELYSLSNSGETSRFSALLAEAVANPAFVVMLSQRSDYFGPVLGQDS